MRIRVACVGVVMLALALPGAATAQVQMSAETRLAQRAAQYPHDISSLLDLAKLYFDQHRFEEAAQILSRAMAVIRQEQLVVVPTTSTPPVPPASGLARADGVLRVGGDIKEPKKIKNVDPIYPPVALAAHVEGYVIIEVLIGKDGQVQDLKVLKEHPLLQDAAVAAVRQWEYEPPLLNGAPVAVLMNVTVLFKVH